MFVLQSEVERVGLVTHRPFSVDLTNEVDQPDQPHLPLGRRPGSACGREEEDTDHYRLQIETSPDPRAIGAGLETYKFVDGFMV